MTIVWHHQHHLDWSEDQTVNHIIDLYNRGHSLSDLAEHFKVDPYTIRKLLLRNYVTLRPRGGRNNYKPLPITKKEYQSTTLRTLAKKYNVSTSTINRHRKENGWHKANPATKKGEPKNVHL